MRVPWTLIVLDRKFQASIHIKFPKIAYAAPDLLIVAIIANQTGLSKKMNNISLCLSMTIKVGALAAA